MQQNISHKSEKVIGETLKRSTPEACFNVAKGLEAIVNDAKAKKPFVKITQYKKVA
jgi:hypothetical protein